jgi:hypothetical protein
MKLNRFIISANGEKLTEVPSMTDVSKFIGCTYQHMYYRMKLKNSNTFKYKKVEYTITDKLEAMQ